MWEEDLEQDRHLVEVSFRNFTDWKTRATTFESMAAMGFHDWSFVLLGEDEPERVPYRAVAASFFETLGAGRTRDRRDSAPSGFERRNHALDRGLQRHWPLEARVARERAEAEMDAIAGSLAATVDRKHGAVLTPFPSSSSGGPASRSWRFSPPWDSWFSSPAPTFRTFSRCARSGDGNRSPSGELSGRAAVRSRESSLRKACSSRLRVRSSALASRPWRSGRSRPSRRRASHSSRTSLSMPLSPHSRRFWASPRARFPAFYPCSPWRAAAVSRPREDSW